MAESTVAEVDLQAELDLQLSNLLDASTTMPIGFEKKIYKAIGVADRIFTTPGIDDSIKAQAAYILMNGCRISRDYPVVVGSNHDDTRKIDLKQKEQKYKDYIAKYDQEQEELSTKNITYV